MARVLITGSNDGIGQTATEQTGRCCHGRVLRHEDPVRKNYKHRLSSARPSFWWITTILSLHSYITRHSLALVNTTLTIATWRTLLYGG